MIIILLIATVIYAIILNNKLNHLRDSKKDMSKFIQAFNEATVRAESGIPKLRKATDAVGADLKEILHKAQMIRDDLAFMIEKADKIADKLENKLTKDNKSNIKEKPNSTKKESKKEEEDISKRASKTMLGALALGEEIELDENRSEAELELIRAIKSIK
jgi:hypothetical protein